MATNRSLNDLDQIHGALCDDCAALWVGGYTPSEMRIDLESDSLSESAQTFAESVEHFELQDETTPGYFDCLICDIVDIAGRRVIAYMKGA